MAAFRRKGPERGPTVGHERPLGLNLAGWGAECELQTEFEKLFQADLVRDNLDVTVRRQTVLARLKENASILSELHALVDVVQAFEAAS